MSLQFLFFLVLSFLQSLLVVHLQVAGLAHFLGIELPIWVLALGCQLALAFAFELGLVQVRRVLGVLPFQPISLILLGILFVSRIWTCCDFAQRRINLLQQVKLYVYSSLFFFIFVFCSGGLRLLLLADNLLVL